MCVCDFSSHSLWTSSSLDVPAGVTQEEGHTGFFIHLPSAVRALIFLARRIQSFLFLVDREVEFLCTNDLIVLHPLGIFYFILFYFLGRKILFTGIELTSQRVRRFTRSPLSYTVRFSTLLHKRFSSRRFLLVIPSAYWLKIVWCK